MAAIVPPDQILKVAGPPARHALAGVQPTRYTHNEHDMHVNTLVAMQKEEIFMKAVVCSPQGGKKQVWVDDFQCVSLFTACSSFECPKTPR
jgi:hypothetical protein